jgi:UDP-N-acetylglucosamine diphosphorylase/glucosamine-1-phosphate N-acetyltransferase
MHRLKAVVLGAGKGTRLSSEKAGIPKVMRLAKGKPLLAYVLKNLDFIEKKDTILVVGYQREAVTHAFPDYPAAIQPQQLGTGHAVAAAAHLIEDFTGDVLICYGDMPLIQKSSYQALVEQHRKEGNACTVLSGKLEEKMAYGRIVRDSSGGFEKISEQKDCTEQEDQIREYNSGVYVFDCAALLNALKYMNNRNAQGEYYITDVPGILKTRKEKVGICALELGDELIGVNTTQQLDQVERLLEGL